MLIRAVLSLLVLMLAGFLVSCGGSTLPDPSPAPTAAPITLQPSPTIDQPTEPAPISAETPAPTVSTVSNDVDQTEIINQGKVLFETTAGGVGCAFCHGLDGKGKAEFASPPNRGATVEQIFNALAERPQMSFIILSNDEVRAIAAYLEVLAEQP